MENSFILKGVFCHTPSRENLEIRENACAVCLDCVCEGLFDEIPERYRGLPLIDCTDRLIVPGMVDLHIHAPQYSFIGTGMDYELLEWLDRMTFPAESRYEDEEYADKAYAFFADKMRRSATTRAVVFGTIHRKSTLTLMEHLENTGIISYVGKVNMDRNAPEYLLEPDARSAAADTRLFLEEVLKRGFERTRPVITPRFAVSCTDELLDELGKISKENALPVQSHLSENPDEVRLVLSLCPSASFYGDVYDQHGLFGRETPCIMAHCVYSTDDEVALMRNNGVFVAHCPASNINLASGIAPVRRYLETGMRVGLGTDVAAGNSESVFRAATDAIQASKLYRLYVDHEAKPLTFPESFYLATKGGGAFFGKVGSFEAGYEFDALVLDDLKEGYGTETAHTVSKKTEVPYNAGPDPCDIKAEQEKHASVRERLEKAFYLELDRTCIVRKFAAGKECAL